MKQVQLRLEGTDPYLCIYLRTSTQLGINSVFHFSKQSLQENRRNETKSVWNQEMRIRRWLRTCVLPVCLSEIKSVWNQEARIRKFYGYVRIYDYRTYVYTLRIYVLQQNQSSKKNIYIYFFYISIENNNVHCT